MVVEALGCFLRSGRSVLRCWAFLLVALVLVSCKSENDKFESDDGGGLGVRIYEDPYWGVDWDNDLRMKGQHHDHIGVSSSRILAYDEAGYDAISLMDYSGNPLLSYAWRSRRWPPDEWLSPSLLASLKNIKVFIPGAEEVGFVDSHVTSAFLTSYIEVRSSGDILADGVGRYSSMSEMFSLIRGGGGVPCLAHHWAPNYGYEGYSGELCVEIYSAFAAAKRSQGSSDFVDIDRNEVLLKNWDLALTRNQRVLGVAVNDHFGPYALVSSVPESVRDSGKIVVMAKVATLDAYKEAVLRGAFFAIRDLGVPKDQFPTVYRIVRDRASIRIESNGVVRWIAGGSVIGSGDTLLFDAVPPRSTYLRAEILGEEGTVVYTQAFAVRPIADVDGNMVVNEADRQICERVSVGLEIDRRRVEACLEGGA